MSELVFPLPKRAKARRLKPMERHVRSNSAPQVGAELPTDPSGSVDHGGSA